MKLPSFGKKIVGLGVDGTDWKLSDRNNPGIDLTHEVGIYYTNQTYQKHPLLEWISKDEIQEMAKALGLLAPSAYHQPKFLKKVGWCGCRLTPENTVVLGDGTRRCRKHYIEYHKKYNAKKKAERAARGGQR